MVCADRLWKVKWKSFRKLLCYLGVDAHDFGRIVTHYWYLVARGGILKVGWGDFGSEFLQVYTFDLSCSTLRDVLGGGSEELTGVWSSVNHLTRSDSESSFLEYRGEKDEKVKTISPSIMGTVPRVAYDSDIDKAQSGATANAFLMAPAVLRSAFT
ncbi:hypothetical protein AVEN_195877-1 [Araneus ventricosus]|uniref:Uncharacterized protein n=1 Tax=Araneus ventricosus TaxID=182803 RepID=A0A4Y2DTY4_ARAVE|nr:hypothetical protein AVEN_195877-1 [Araneus ventricosus]